MLKARRLSQSTEPHISPLQEAAREIRAPNASLQAPDQVEDFPTLGYRELRDARIVANRRVSAVVVGTELLLPEAADSGPWNLGVGEPSVGGFLRQLDDDLLVNLGRKNAIIERGIFVGSWSPHNWFHWMIDILPTIWLANGLSSEYDEFPILLPENSVQRAAWGEPLALVLGNRALEFYSESNYTKVAKLLVVDSPTSPGPLPISRVRPRPNYRLHSTAMAAYRLHMLRALGLTAQRADQSRRIFLARRGPNREYVSSVIHPIVERFGFEPVYLEDLSLAESVQVFLEAHMIIGPHGAGWANALFCQPDTRAFMWTWDESTFDNWFANIAALADLDFTVHIGGPVATAGYHPQPEELTALLEAWLEIED
jgi:hypothetical protein